MSKKQRIFRLQVAKSNLYSNDSFRLFASRWEVERMSISNQRITAMVAIKALVVDDSGVMRKMVMKGLSDSKLAEFEFVEAADGQDALSKFDPKTIDIGFIDWNMPNMSGVDFVREIRSLYGGGPTGVPMVMVTSEKTMGKIEEALDDAGADAFICKPFTVEELQSKLKKTVDKAGIRRIRREASQKKPQQTGGLLAKLFG